MPTLKQMLNYPKNFVKGRMQTPTQTFEEVQQGEGAVVEVDGKKVAVYKKSATEVVELSPICPHMGCVVGWNSKEKTWDCPCHGSRFSNEGKVIHGPATKDMEKK